MEADGSGGRWPDVQKLNKCDVVIDVDNDEDRLLHHSWTTGGAAGKSTGAIAERGDSVGYGVGGGSCGAGVDGEIITRGVGAAEIDEDGDGHPHHSGAAEGAAGFITSAATHASARGSGFVRHGAIGGGGGYSVEVPAGRGVVEIDGDGSGPSHHSGVTKGATGFATGSCVGAWW